MSAIFLPRRWRHQPQGAVELDQANEFGRAVRFLFHPPAGPVDLCTGIKFTSGVFNPVAAPHGLSHRKLGVTSTYRLGTPANPTYAQFQQTTIFALYQSIPGGGNNGEVISRSMGTATPSWGVGLHRGSTDGLVGLLNGTIKDYTGRPIADIGDAASEVLFFTALTFENGNLKIYANGSSVHTSSGYGAIDYSRTDTSINFGGASQYGFAGDIYLAGVLEGALSAEAVEAFGAVPWQIFRAPSHRIWFDMGAAAPSTPVLDAQPGTVTATGLVAGLTARRLLDAQPGTATAAGSTAGLVVRRLLDAQPAAVSIAGSQAGLLARRSLEASPGSVTLMGADAGLRVSRLLTADPGAITVTGADAAFQLEGVFTLDAQPGTVTVTGAAAGLIVNRLGRSNRSAGGGGGYAGNKEFWREIDDELDATLHAVIEGPKPPTPALVEAVGGADVDTAEAPRIIIPRVQIPPTISVEEMLRAQDERRRRILLLV